MSTHDSGPMTPGPDLDASVSKALGERVCGGKARMHEDPAHHPLGSHTRCDGCGAPWEYGPDWPGGWPKFVHLPPLPYSTSWEAAGRLVEEMERRGFWMEIRNTVVPGPKWQVIFGGVPGGFVDVLAPTLPHALSLAALRALGEKGEG